MNGTVKLKGYHTRIMQFKAETNLTIQPSNATVGAILDTLKIKATVHNTHELNNLINTLQLSMKSLPE